MNKHEKHLNEQHLNAIKFMCVIDTLTEIVIVNVS